MTEDGETGPPAAWKFTVLPPWWHRPWFVAFAGTVLVATVTGIGWRRSVRARAIEQIRTRIAGDLHDDVGANLTRIAVLSEVLRDVARPDDVGHLTSIGEAARDSVTTMSDIVWAIKPHDDDAQDLVRRMRGYGEEVCGAAGIAFAIDMSADRGSSRLRPDVRRDLYLVFRRRSPMPCVTRTAAPCDDTPPGSTPARAGNR